MNSNNNQITLPINLSLAVGAYTTKLWIGSEQIEVNVLIDTGSSTLAIDLKKYNPDQDKTLKTSTYAQAVIYGSGGWAGPVIHSQVELNHNKKLMLTDAPLAITANNQQNNFQQADGIWGLAYHHLNKAYDTSDYLTQHQLDSTFPWPFDEKISTTSVASFKKYLHQEFPEHDITPLFTAFEENSITANQFALSTQRSIVFVPKQNMSQQEIASEPMNQGQFIIGADVGDQSKLSMKVVHDAYYNTELITCTVAGFEPCSAPPLQKEKLNSFFSNAIIDSGCSFLVLQKTLYAYVMKCLNKINSEHIDAIQAAQQAFKEDQEYKNQMLDLSQWPNITLKFSGIDDKTIELVIPPQCYWQQHARKPNNWIFMIMNQLPQWPDQSICGLPLMNNYYCVFDRSENDNGMIHWLNKLK